MKRRSSGNMTMQEQMEKNKGGWKPSGWTLPDGYETFRLDPEKKHQYIDLIPFIAGRNNPSADKGRRTFFRTYWVHKNMGPDNKTLLCCEKNKVNGKSEPCYACKKAQLQYEKAGGDMESKAYKVYSKIKAQKRQLFCVKAGKNKKGKIRIWDVSDYSFLAKLSELEDDLPKKKLTYAEPTCGWTIKLKIKKKKFGGSFFGEITRISIVKRKKQYKEKIVKEAPCLDKLIKKPLPAKKIKKIFLGAMSDGSKGKSKKSGKKKG